MKKISIFFAFLIFFSNFKFCENLAFANVENATYAKALVGCTLYKNENLDNSIDNIYFVIPESYFVLVLRSVNDNCLLVQYDKYIGYVDVSTVVISTFIPEVKTLENITCDIKDTSGTQIWSLPSATTGRVLTTILSGTKDIHYIAYVYGTIPSGGESNLWYYVSYTPSTNETDVYEGYVYSENITNLSEIPINTENNPEPNIEANEDSDNNSFVISSSFQTIIIAIISIPIILLISIILYKLIKKLKENTNNRKNLKNEKYEKFDTSSISAYNYQDSNNNKLKQQIDNLSKKSFIRKRRHSYGISNYHSDGKYPEFPSYNSDDDLLWYRFFKLAR